MRYAPLHLVLLTALLTAGCSTPRYFQDRTPPVATPHPASGDSPRNLPMFAGHDGRPLAWSDLLDAVQWAEIVIIGEQHDDGMGHAVQLAVVEDALDRWPRSALAMEMLERDEQVLVDDYLDGIIDVESFVRMTFSSGWAGEGNWEKWFQPIIDTAKRHGARVIAANAPRRYVRLARTSGYPALDALPGQRRRLFDYPRPLPRDAYFDRFAEVMSHIDDPAALDAMYRSQSVWDATMAQSILRARPSRNAKVIHLVGRFHSDFGGGLVRELRADRPQARILVLSMNKADAAELLEEDRGRADIIIYTGSQDEGPTEPEDAADEDEAPPVH